MDIIVRSDNIFESAEEFRGQATTTVPGVNIDPSETTIEIADVDGNDKVTLWEEINKCCMSRML